MVEKRIKAGHLTRYLREVDQGVDSGQPIGRITSNPVAPLKPIPAINYILGSPTDDYYQSKQQQKRLVRAATVKAKVNVVHTKRSQGEVELVDGPISFLSVNPNRVIMPHYDALVLTLCINGFDVHRVLVDSGRVVDLPQLPAFTQMKLSPGMVNLVWQILFDFNKATTTTLGDITLPVTVRPFTQGVLFLVIEDLGPYNALVGRAWLHSMKAVSSTYYQMVSYLTTAGQVDLLGSQLGCMAILSIDLAQTERETQF